MPNEQKSDWTPERAGRAAGRAAGFWALGVGTIFVLLLVGASCIGLSMAGLYFVFVKSAFDAAQNPTYPARTSRL